MYRMRKSLFHSPRAAVCISSAGEVSAYKPAPSWRSCVLSPREVPQEASSEWNMPRSGQKFVPVIDDSMTIRKIIETCLRRAEYEVKAFPDEVEAMGWLTTPQARVPALVFVDLRGPSLDGIEVIRRLRARPAFGQTVFVMISGRDGIRDRLKREAGFRERLPGQAFQNERDYRWCPGTAWCPCCRRAMRWKQRRHAHGEGPVYRV